MIKMTGDENQMSTKQGLVAIEYSVQIFFRVSLVIIAVTLLCPIIAFAVM
ncbi:hypothetical protein [Morganella psychrotolerans]